LFIGITVDWETEQSEADCRDFVCYIGGIGAGRLKLILQQEALDLVVIDADGNDDGAEGAITGGEAAAHFLSGPVEVA
jgi:hypothetical protein